MNKNILFLEEIKTFVTSGLSLIEFQFTFNKSSEFIFKIARLMAENQYILTLEENIDAVIFDLLIMEEMAQTKTYYGALVTVAEEFELSETYIKCKIANYKSKQINYKFSA
ncbi:hypothetical protein [Bacillus solitudinis]|uniref:hypothetical protein n=1 Tax=Bacillus solitudinis TaxID=2014074 RepID=UPI000C230742|nr:hypothetical protein [Bacillus solitudinis]